MLLRDFAAVRLVELRVESSQHFNMATFFQDGDPACNATNWAAAQKPSSFQPTHLNVSNWCGRLDLSAVIAPFS